MRISFILIVLLVFGSCVENEKTKPEGFDQFWEDAIGSLDTLVVSEKIKDSVVKGKRWGLYKVKSYNEIYFYSWVSEPLIEGKFPVKIRFSALGNKEILNEGIPNAWFLKEENMINMMVDVRGQGLSLNQIEYKDYLTQGLSNIENYVYRGAYMDAVRSVDFIAQNPKVNGNIIVTGGSQGGTLSIVAAALNPKVTMCITGFPFFTDIRNYNKKDWPMNIFMFYCMKYDLDYFDLVERLSYFDMLYFTDKIDVPVFVRTQELDKIAPKEGIVKFFNRLQSEKKELYVEPCEGHGCSSNSKNANELERAFIKANMLYN